MNWVTATGELVRLRAEFPGWGIFHDPHLRRWYAVYGRRAWTAAATPQELRWSLLRSCDSD